MKKSHTLLFVAWLVAGLFFFYLSCNNVPTSQMNPPRSVSWINIQTGLSDSFTMTDPEILAYIDSFNTAEEFYDFLIGVLDSGGFDITWGGTGDAEYYEIRVSKSRITESNWDKASVAAKVPANGSSDMFTSLKVLKPTISGNNCTGCEYCVAACPNNAITIFRNKAVIDLSLCTGCGRCYDTCNYDAVSDCFLGEDYYFAVRAYASDDTPSEEIASTDHTFKLRYTNWIWQDEAQKTPVCGACGAGCYILLSNLIGKGCPVGAIKYDSTGIMFGKKGMVYIDQTKCIYCGKCLTKCIVNNGFWSIRREVVSSRN